MSPNLEGLRATTDRLFQQIHDKVWALNSNVTGLRERVEGVRRKLERISSDPNKATRLHSAPSLPSECSEGIQLGLVEYEGVGGFKRGDILDQSITQEQAVEQLQRLVSNHARLVARNPLDGITNVASLLVFHTYESRIVTPGGRISGRSQTSDSSIQDYATGPASRQTGLQFGRSVRHSFVNNKSSSNEEEPGGAAELGPAPTSILLHHQDSVLDVANFFDDSETLEADESQQLIGDLPDILPSLSGIVRDVGQLLDERPGLRASSSLRDLKSLERPPEVAASSAIPPPPPPPLPSEPLHAIPAIGKDLNLATQNAPNIPGPPPPPAPPAAAIGEPEEATDKPTTAGPPLAGRDALMAEIRSAALKPKPVRKERPVKEVEAGSRQSLNDLMLEEVRKQKPLKPVEQNQRPLLELPPANPRDSLLASIREAAGKPKPKAAGQKVARADRQKVGERQPESGQGTAGQLNLMSDLINKLQARRDGISGSFGEVTLEKASIVPSMVIPGRPESSCSSEASHEFNEEDWK